MEIRPKNHRKIDRRFSVLPIIVCGPFIPLVSILGQSGPSMFWRKVPARVQSWRKIRSHHASGGLRAENFARKGPAPAGPQPSSLKIDLEALVFLFRTLYKSRLSDMNRFRRGGPLASPGTVCYAEKQEKPFWFSSLGQMVQFDTIIFRRTFVELFLSVRVD